MKKGLFSVFLFVSMAVSSIFSQTALDFNVTLNKTGDGVIIMGYTGKATTVRIPARIEGVPVKEIGKEAFMSNKIITNIVIPSGVTSIGDSAFFLCSNLTTISLPDSIINIGKHAFMHSGLTSISIPKNISFISENAFANCQQLKTVTINGNVTEIQSGAFTFNTLLTEIKLPATIQTIGERAFQGCTSLASVTIPNSTGTINFEKLAFAGCTKLNLASQALLKQRGYTF